MKKLAVFASGSGSNALKIHEYFKKNNFAKIDCVLVNNPNSGIVKKAEKWDCKIQIITKNNIHTDSNISKQLLERGIDLVILAGFLWLIPDHLLSAFPQKIINIHPSLLPKYGGKGMYGDHVHQAVIEAKEKESGITIHFVNEQYDEGEIIFQAKCSINPNDSSEDLANKIHSLEYEHFPKVIEESIR